MLQSGAAITTYRVEQSFTCQSVGNGDFSVMPHGYEGSYSVAKHNLSGSPPLAIFVVNKTRSTYTITPGFASGSGTPKYIVNKSAFGYQVQMAHDAPSYSGEAVNCAEALIASDVGILLGEIDQDEEWNGVSSSRGNLFTSSGTRNHFTAPGGGLPPHIQARITTRREKTLGRTLPQKPDKKEIYNVTMMMQMISRRNTQTDSITGQEITKYLVQQNFECRPTDENNFALEVYDRGSQQRTSIFVVRKENRNGYTVSKRNASSAYHCSTFSVRKRPTSCLVTPGFGSCSESPIKYLVSQSLSGYEVAAIRNESSPSLSSQEDEYHVEALNAFDVGVFLCELN
ncbi:uncharacterized protein LY89DRAFT_730812 [Mollisia scopiformis]|uniref:Uncharacterized protein n=1 Tax=Mollisia scopiformis TaxID=149040 RepID=A0A194XM05_MOLSC|nr:uncharacterized protein LY89DRAFT_730812 [Mollisia scopiformis]KUJ20797.1 hypothetical protein LY89DRAFT_730812 [Mollisia scopiformis]